MTIMKKINTIKMMPPAVMRVKLTVMKTTMMKMKKTMKMKTAVIRVLLTVMKTMIERGHVQCIHTWVV